MSIKIRAEVFIKIFKSFGLPGPIAEYKFHPKRKWRIDYAWPEFKLAVEVEGGIYSRGRHVRPRGFMGDIEKYNALTLAGWHLLRFTWGQMRSGEALASIREFIEKRQV